MKQLCFLLLMCLWGMPPAQARDGACEPITIFAAASTTDALNAIADAYEIETACSVSTVFAGSGTLARQIQAGAPADIFLSANTEWMDWLLQSGTVRRVNTTNLLTNQLVIVVPKDSAFTFVPGAEPALLAEIRNGRMAVGDPASVPAGAYALQALDELGLLKEAEPHLVRAASVRHALAWVARGEAATGIVYRTDARLSDGVRIAGVFSEANLQKIRYPVALIGSAPNTAARAFFDHLQSYAAVTVFADHGFERASD